MRKILFAGILLLTVSCSRLEIPVPTDGPRAVVTFGATMPEPESKVAYDGENTTWVAGDKIKIYYDGGSVTATAQSGGSASTTFVTDEAIPTDKAVYCAVYPSTRNASFDGSDVTVDFTQTNEAGTLACSAICTAKTFSCGGSLEFYNTGAMIKFTTTSNTIHEARFYGGNGNVYSLVGSNSDARIPYSAGTYYVPVPADTASEGFFLRLKNYDGEDYPAFYRSASRTFEAGHIYNVGTIESKVLTEGTGGTALFRLMSFNILRGDLGSEGNKWADRKDACLAMLSADAPDILGLQECTSTQRNDILAAFPQYGAVGISVQGASVNAYTNVSSNPILYNGSIFLLERFGTYWLSDEPTRNPTTSGSPNNTWYYDKPRTATWAQFKVQGQDRHFVFVCLHLQDDSSSINSTYEGQGATYGPLCRSNEIQVITDNLATMNPNGYPMVIAGDLNSSGTESYYSTLRSTFSLARETAATADTGSTFNGFSGANSKTLDNIFYKDFTAYRFVVDRAEYAGRTYISDHYPVYCDFAFSTFDSALDGWNVEDIQE